MMQLPFSPAPAEMIDDLRARLRQARYPLLPSGLGWQRGTDPDELRNLVDHWQTGYDWREHESRVLALSWRVVESASGSLRVVHQPAADAQAPVVLLLHGWPDSVLRFKRVLQLLEGVHVVVPALPGFPFASPHTATGMNVKAMAVWIAEAMAELGYDRYVISGGDVGADVAEHLATLYPERVSALHLTNISPLHAVFADRSTLDAEGLAYLDRVALWQRKEGGYIAEQSTKPHTLAPALADSPVGLAAWLLEKLHGWSHAAFTQEELLTWISVYWFTGAIGTSFAPYVEFVAPVPYVATPTVLSTFAHDTKPAPRSFAKRFVNIRHFSDHTEGGHFAAYEQPERYVEDLRLALAI